MKLCDWCGEAASNRHRVVSGDWVCMACWEEELADARREKHRFGHPDGHANDVGYGPDDGYGEDPLGGSIDP